MEIRKERTARKRHDCYVDLCTSPIEPGQRYIDSRLTPNDPDIGNVGWWRAKLHLPGDHSYEVSDGG